MGLQARLQAHSGSAQLGRGWAARCAALGTAIQVLTGREPLRLRTLLPCTQEFYESVVRRKLAPGGIFVTQSGPAGTLSAQLVFTSIHKTLVSVFPTVMPYAHHIPSLCDCWGFNIAFRDQGQGLLIPSEYDKRAKLRIRGELQYVDGDTFVG